MKRVLLGLAIFVSLELGRTTLSQTPVVSEAGAQGYPAQSSAAPAKSASPASRSASGPEFRPSIPQTWDDLRTFEVPLADSAHSPDDVSWDYYYRVPWRPIFKSYPVYAPGHEPSGYFEWLKQQEPQVVWGIDSEGVSHKPPLRTEADWIQAGEMVFDSPIAYDTDPWGKSVATVDDVRNPAWYAATGTPAAQDGVVPFARYVIRKKGIVELGQQSCGMCHTRVMPDGAIVKGAQGNFPFDRAAALELQKSAARTPDKEQLLERVRWFWRASYGAPWVDTDAQLNRLTLDQVVEALKAIPPGVIARTGSSPFSPVQTPDLIGVKDRQYLDHTGLAQQHSTVDLMRYAALNQDMKGLARYGDFIPEGIDFRRLPDPATRSRYLDEQLYALALYVYSLQPPPNPNPFDAEARRGQQVFEREGCVRCHTPPLYTNNKLTVAEGFTPPANEVKDYDILLASVGTDPSLALQTRRGTGFYKVPSLKGLWYRGMFPHDGSCATLEDWFDPRRLRDDYVPTGFRGVGVKTRAVQGHPFGLKLSPEDQQALIKFLKTL